MTNQKTERTEYIQGYIFGCLKAFKSFDAIRYIKDLSSGAEYIRITDRLGGKAHLNITNITDDEVFRDVARLVLNSRDEEVKLPTTLVTDEKELFKIADLFESGGGLYE